MNYYDGKDSQDLVFNITNAGGDELTLRTPYDADMEDMAHLFRTIAFWLTFSMETIDEYLMPINGWPEDDPAEPEAGPEEPEDTYDCQPFLQPDGHVTTPTVKESLTVPKRKGKKEKNRA